MKPTITDVEKKLDAVQKMLRDDMPMVQMSELAWENHEERGHAKDKRHLIIDVILIIALLVSNFAWIMLWNQYDTAAIDISNDGGGNAYYNEKINGDICNGKD